jgi:tRNA-specific 2-thiouridylase
MVQIRYRSAAVPATVMPILGEGESDRVRIVFDEPQFSITPGQAAVWYDDASNCILLGGGIIEPSKDSPNTVF